ncbi:MAG TPA: hypothetical protein ENG47_01575 [Candidatus Aerophobetes bacterium]|uniref:Uncharacterized protein n=1 Tax=Aerophobetes bacterium TaxID=2030807 RepID=A0A7V0N0C5_UNCAE|nr:hypothetical protein [Candidatus Aerophobetes bacterium]
MKKLYWCVGLIGGILCSAFTGGVEEFVLRRIKAPSIIGWIEGKRQFLVRAQALLQEDPNCDEVFVVFKQLQEISQKSDFSLRLPVYVKQEINELFRDVERVLSEYEDYLSQNFRRFFGDIDVPFPSEYLKAIWKGQIEFASNPQELRRQLEEGFMWVKRHRQGLFTSLVYKWKQVPLPSLRMLIDLALWEKGERFLCRESFLRTRFAIYGGRSLRGFIPLYGGLHPLLLKLKLYPSPCDYSNWKEYIIEAKKNGGGIDTRVVSQEVMSPFTQRQFLEEGSQELGEDLYEFVNRRNFFKRYEFLSGSTLSFLLHGYKSLEELRQKLEIPPQDLSGWQELLDRGVRVRWDEVDDEVKVELILARIPKSCWNLIPRDFVKAGLYGLLDRYGSVEALQKELLIPQLLPPELITFRLSFSQLQKIEEAVKRFSRGDLSWESLNPAEVKLIQRYVLLRACSSLNMRVSEFFSDPDNFSLPLPVFNNKSLDSLIAYWGGIPQLIEGLELRNILETQWESNSYPAYATYWSLVLIVKIAQDLNYLQAEINLDNLHKLAWEASFGYKKLETVLNALSLLGKDEEIFNKGKKLGGIFRKILVYLTLNKVFQVNGEQFQIMEEEFQKRFSSLREILLQEKANEYLLSAQLRRIWPRL